MLGTFTATVIYERLPDETSGKLFHSTYRITDPMSWEEVNERIAKISLSGLFFQNEDNPDDYVYIAAQCICGIRVHRIKDAARISVPPRSLILMKED